MFKMLTTGLVTALVARRLSPSVLSGEGQSLASDTVDIRRLLTHHTATVVADVPGANIVTPDHENVWLLLLCGRNAWKSDQQTDADQEGQVKVSTNQTAVPFEKWTHIVYSFANVISNVFANSF